VCKAGRGLVFARLVALGAAFGKLTLQIGNQLRGIGRIIRCGFQPSPSLIPSPLMGEGRGGGERSSRRIPG
jgi:hypothetical protein